MDYWHRTGYAAGFFYAPAPASTGWGLPSQAGLKTLQRAGRCLCASGIDVMLTRGNLMLSIGQGSLPSLVGGQHWEVASAHWPRGRRGGASPLRVAYICKQSSPIDQNESDSSGPLGTLLAKSTAPGDHLRLRENKPNKGTEGYVTA